MASADEKIISTRLSNTRSIASAITTLLVCIFLFPIFMALFGGNSVIESVKKGHYSTYPSITLEDAFTKYYRNPQWKRTKSSTGNDIVVFTGQCTEDGKVRTIELRYAINKDDSFMLAGGSIDGVESNVFILSYYASQPFEQY